MRVSKICLKIIKAGFHTLFFLVPLILTPFNFELFEYNKMMLTYGLTVVIVAAWLIKMISERRFFVRRTPLDFPLLLFLGSQVVSTIFSIDRHTSIFGYYSRFHGGLLSSISYILLYYALVSHLGQDEHLDEHLRATPIKVFSLLRTALFSALLVATYGILEHPNPLFRNPDGSWRGIDAGYWVQDVELRVFSTIGQPNWLAAYLAMLIPVAMAFMLIEKRLCFKAGYLLLATGYYWCLLFTNSRAGAAGLFTALLVFFSFFFLKYLTLRWPIGHLNANKGGKAAMFSKRNLIFLGVAFLIFGVLTLVSGGFLLARFAEVLPLPKKQSEQPAKKGPLPSFVATASPTLTPPPPQGPTVPPGETGRIRSIVWRGAIEIFKHYPIFGSGVETFAYSYYQFRPVEHNLTTEWDFLYNKAHNEYLNFLATTGIVGLSSYMLLVLTFIWWCGRNIKNQISKIKNRGAFCVLLIAFLSSYIAYLVQNIYSFSVVPIATFFFLFPAVAFVLAGKLPVVSCQLSVAARPIIRRLLTTIILIASAYCLITLLQFWQADTLFAKATNLAQAGYFKSSYLYINGALSKNPWEPVYWDQLAFNAAVLAVASKEATTQAFLTQEALNSSRRALTTSPLNVNFWKTAIKTLYELGELNSVYYQKAIEATDQAILLSPTDPKLAYNLGLLYIKTQEEEKALGALKKAIDLKPNYRDPHYALGILYHKLATEGEKVVNQKNLKKAISEMEYILKNLDPGDAEAQEKIRAWSTQSANL